jgi:hypothetical protein
MKQRQLLRQQDHHQDEVVDEADELPLLKMFVLLVIILQVITITDVELNEE